MTDIREELIETALRARSASMKLAALTAKEKNDALAKISERLIEDLKPILKANSCDLDRAKKAGVGEAMLDRLKLDKSRIEAISESIKKVISLDDPTAVSDCWVRPNGLHIERRRVPIGVIGIIYEARPNVTCDASALCIKSGNAVILRGGSNAIESNRALISSIRAALKESGLPEDAVSLIESTDRAYTNELLTLTGYIDLIIPRGGKGLIEVVKNNARVPVIETGAGNCHLYIHEDADIEMAKNILINAKTSRPSVCNAIETLLVHKNIAEKFLPIARDALKAEGHNTRLLGCPETKRILGDQIIPATEEDYATEFDDYILAVKVVDSLDEAIEHINRYNTKHSEVIVTNSISASKKFSDEIDAACVYTNASSRFTDGEEFGFGAEIGISTQKLHARGPMGLSELTSIKYYISGEGQVR